MQISYQNSQILLIFFCVFIIVGFGIWYLIDLKKEKKVNEKELDQDRNLFDEMNLK